MVQLCLVVGAIKGLLPISLKRRSPVPPSCSDNGGTKLLQSSRDIVELPQFSRARDTRRNRANCACDPAGPGGHFNIFKPERERNFTLQDSYIY